MTTTNTHRAIFIGTGLLILVGLFIAINSIAAPAITVQISYINVGQGDSILIEDSTGFTALIDGGKTSAGDDLLAYLQEAGINEIDMMIATHADADHIGGLIDVLQDDTIFVGSVYYNGYPGTTQTWTNFVTAANDDGLVLTSLQYPQVLTWGAGTAYILNPEPGLSNPEQNAASVVILLDYGDIEAIFTGDIDTNTEANIIAHGTPLASEFLKVAHHGSQYSSSTDFLAAVQPEEAVISVGDNSYGHPAPETLIRLQTAGAQIWRTDQNGTILIVTDGFSYEVIAEISPVFAYLPLIIHSELIPTSTPTLTQTVPPGPTQSPTPLPQPANIQILDIQETGSEYVEIQNQGSQGVQLLNWTIRDIANHVYTFPSFVIEPGQICRIYTSEDHPEWCGFNYGSGATVWNNDGDCAYLRDANDQLMDEYCY